MFKTTQPRPAPYTHHQNQGPQALCQALLEKQVPDVEDLCRLLKNCLLFFHHEEVASIHFG